MTVDHALRQRLVFALLAVTLLVGWWTKARCLPGGWDGTEQWLGWCYNDVFPLWWAERLHEGAVPYLDHPVEYPVLIGLQMWIAAQVLYALDAGAAAFYHVNALIGVPLLVLAVLRLQAAGLPPHRLAWFAGAPTLAVYAFFNWDPLAVFLLVLAVERHLKGHDVASGIAAGLGTAAKLFPAVLIPLVVLARWEQGRARDAVRHVVAAAAAWAVVNVPVLVAAPRGWLRFLELNRERGANYDSLWYLLDQVRRTALSRPVLNLASALLFLGGAATIVALGRRYRPPDEYYVLAAPVLAWFLVVNKVYSPQYSLWLLPLLPLALPRAAPFAAFLVADLLVFAVEFPFLGHVVGVQPAPGYGVLAFALLVRAATLVWIIVEVVAPGPAARAGVPLPRSALDLPTRA